jgi:hypothetical protein
MEFCHLIVAQIFNRESRAPQFCKQCFAFLQTLAELNSNKNVGIAIIRIAIVELGDAPPSDGLAEAAKTTGLLRNLGREQHLGRVQRCGAAGQS